MHLALEAHPYEAAARPDSSRIEFGRPSRFLPQKTVAIRRFLALAALTFLVGTAALATLLFRF